MKVLIKALFRMFGYEVIPRRWTEVPEHKEHGFDESFLPLYRQCEPFTMTSCEKMFALYRAVGYLNKNGIGGAIVESGVAAGGSMMLVALTCIQNDSVERNLWLYDTFAGMPKPTEKDINYRGDLAETQWAASQDGGHNRWCYASLESVKENMTSTGYPTDRLRYVQGRVEDTIPGQAPDDIALLRLDTDWYESTKHELTFLYPRLREGGVLIIDDYGHWEGCRQAADEYFVSIDEPMPLLIRIDRLGVIAVKPKRSSRVADSIVPLRGTGVQGY